MVPQVGLEPTRGCPHRILSPACLPFHHCGIVDVYENRDDYTILEVITHSITMDNTPQDPEQFDSTALIKKRAYLYSEKNPAADLIRQKLDTLYKKEPDAVEEVVDSVSLGTNKSKHQRFMHNLSTSGKPLATIQNEWHAYYQDLNDTEKHEVWQEFYAANQQHATLYQAQSTLPAAPQHFSQANQPSDDPRVIAADMTQVVATKTPVYERPKSTRTVAEIKKQITGSVKVRGKLSKRQHLQSLGFGLAMGALVVVVLLFGFFNERFIAPFITPSRNVSATPLILDINSAAVDPSPQIIIPKINVQVPAVYDVPTIEEADVQLGLERGIVHYVTTSTPGEKGNSVFFGHSSSNILNRGRFKYAFVLLGWLEVNDTFYIQKGGVRYVYKVFQKKVVNPTDVSVLDPVVGHPATATLITCDPPGSNIKRMVITADQISPDPTGNATSTAKGKDAPGVLAGNSESLWHRMWNAVF